MAARGDKPACLFPAGWWQPGHGDSVGCGSARNRFAASWPQSPRSWGRRGWLRQPGTSSRRWGSRSKWPNSPKKLTANCLSHTAKRRRRQPQGLKATSARAGRSSQPHGWPEPSPGQLAAVRRGCLSGRPPPEAGLATGRQPLAGRHGRHAHGGSGPRGKPRGSQGPLTFDDIGARLVYVFRRCAVLSHIRLRAPHPCCLASSCRSMRITKSPRPHPHRSDLIGVHCRLARRASPGC